MVREVKDETIDEHRSAIIRYKILIFVYVGFVNANSSAIKDSVAYGRAA